MSIIGRSLLLEFILFLLFIRDHVSDSGNSIQETVLRREIVKCTLEECADPEVERKIQCYSFIGQGSVVEVAFFCFPFAELI